MTNTTDLHSLETQIRILRELMGSGALPAEVGEASIAALRAQMGGTTYSSQVQGGAAAQGTGAKAVGQNGILVEGNFTGNIYRGPDPAEEEQQLAIYRRMVVQSSSSLPLRGVDIGASDPSLAQKAIGLANVYVDLDTTRLVKLTAAQGKGQKKAGNREVLEKTRPLAVLEAVIANRSLVLLGDPGGGKSTFVNFLAACLAAHALEPGAGWLEHIRGWPAEEGEILPVVVLLRDFARSAGGAHPEKAEEHHLLDFIRARLTAQNLGFAAGPLEKALESGQALVLLDGLDEVPSPAERIFVRDAGRAFMRRYPGCRFLITCRVLSYQAPGKGRPDQRLAELPDFQIAPFDKAKIDHFVAAWYAELGRLGTVPAGEVGPLSARLGEAVRRTDLGRLAHNPLLLTVMALVHAHRGRLPDARALLYEETIDMLLLRWDQIRMGARADDLPLRRRLLEAGRTEVDLKRVLGDLAFAAQAGAKTEGPGEDLADIGEHRILKALAALKCDERCPEGDLSWASQVVDLMKLRAGLLLERQPEVFTFPHRTFQEYLAGAHLAAQANFACQAAELARTGVLWRECILYAAGKLVYVMGDLDKPLALAAELCPEQAEDSDPAWRLAWLAGDVLLEIGLRRAGDSALGRDLLRRVRLRLKDLLEGGRLAPAERVRAGDTLAALGDPRFRAEDWFLPGEDLAGFLHISAGRFFMGSEDGDADERPRHALDLPYDFWIAKYPVTVAQYRAFVEASGYGPGDPGSLDGIANHPVVRVTWKDALAYCAWLDGRLKQLAKQKLDRGRAGAFWEGLAGGILQVCLPSEAEWEKAARGSGGRIFPWDGQADPGRANVGEARTGGTSPVGAFPDGENPYSVLDLSGNIWQWTRTIWDEKFRYPYKLEDGRENLNGESLRVVRGGPFLGGSRLARCSYRNRLGPNASRNLIGFRVGVSAPIHL